MPASRALSGRVRGAALGRRHDPVGVGAVSGAGAAVEVSGDPADRGDVPGWVLVTLMTAGLVSALWLVAGDALVNLFQTAISHVAP